MYTAGPPAVLPVSEPYSFTFFRLIRKAGDALPTQPYLDCPFTGGILCCVGRICPVPYRAVYLLSVCFFLLRGHLAQRRLLHRAAQVVGNAELGLTDGAFLMP